MNSDVLFWIYWALSWLLLAASLVGALILIYKILIDTDPQALNFIECIKHNYQKIIAPPRANIFSEIGSRAESLFGLLGTVILAAVVSSIILTLGGSVGFAAANIGALRGPTSCQLVYPPLFLSTVTHAYWVEGTNSLVLNDIAPEEYDEDILNVQIYVQYLFQGDSPYYAEVIATAVRPFSIELSREFQITLFETKEWQWKPLKRRDDDRRYREYCDGIRELPGRQQEAFMGNVNTLLLAYLVGTVNPTIDEAELYLNTYLHHDWSFETVRLIPKTNNW